MTAFLILGGIACLVFAVPMAMGTTDPRRIALTALFIAAPLEVYRADALVGNVSVFRIVLVVALVVTVRYERSNLFAFGRRPIALLASLLLAMIALSLLFQSDNRSLGVTVFGQGVVVLLAALATASLARSMPMRSILMLVCVGAVAPVLVAATQGFYGHAGRSIGVPLVNHLPVPAGLEVTREGTLYLGADGIRLKGTFGDPNHFAAWLAFVLAASVALAISAALHARRDLAIAGAIWTLGVLVVLLATYSRTGWLSVGVGLICAATATVFAASARAVLRCHRLWVVATVLVCILTIVPLSPRIAERLDNNRSANQISNDSHARTTRVAFEEFKAHPLTGIGVGDLGPRLGQDLRTSGAHSSYLTVAAELGGLGLSVMITLLVLVAWSLLPPGDGLLGERFARLGLFCAYVGFMAANAFYDLMWDDFHWLFVGLALAVAPRRSGAEQSRRLGTEPQMERST